MTAEQSPGMMGGQGFPAKPLSGAASRWFWLGLHSLLLALIRWVLVLCRSSTAGPLLGSVLGTDGGPRFPGDTLPAGIQLKPGKYKQTHKKT